MHESCEAQRASRARKNTERCPHTEIRGAVLGVSGQGGRLTEVLRIDDGNNSLEPLKKKKSYKREVHRN